MTGTGVLLCGILFCFWQRLVLVGFLEFLHGIIVGCDDVFFHGIFLLLYKVGFHPFAASSIPHLAARQQRSEGNFAKT